MDYDKLLKEVPEYINSIDPEFIEEWLKFDREQVLISKINSPTRMKIGSNISEVNIYTKQSSSVTSNLYHTDEYGFGMAA